MSFLFRGFRAALTIIAALSRAREIEVLAEPPHRLV